MTPWGNWLLETQFVPPMVLLRWADTPLSLTTFIFLSSKIATGTQELLKNGSAPLPSNLTA